MLKAVANATQDRKLKSVIWQRTEALRCALEFGGEGYGLYTEFGGQALVVEGTLDEVLASVPDEDFAAVVKAAATAGKPVGAPSSSSKRKTQ